MDISELYFAIPILSFVFVLILIHPVRRLATMVNLVDNPNARKVHKCPVPLVGGIVVIISSALTLLFTPDFWLSASQYYILVIGAAIFLIIGVIDDKMDIRSVLKLVLQFILAYFVFDRGIRIESLFGIFGIYELPLATQFLFTTIVIVGVVNAFNLMDGIDGLAAGLAIIGLSTFTYIAFITGNTFLVIMYLSLIGALVGFLKYNLSSKSKIFMGDAGSLALGFILVVSGIILIQSAAGTANFSVSITTVIGVLALPVADSLRVYRKRIKTGYSPFRADKTHFHHLVLYLGLNHKIASVMIIGLSFCIVVLSVLFGSIFSITLSISSILLLFILISSILTLNRQINIWKKKIGKMEDCNEINSPVSNL